MKRCGARLGSKAPGILPKETKGIANYKMTPTHSKTSKLQKSHSSEFCRCRYAASRLHHKIGILMTWLSAGSHASQSWNIMYENRTRSTVWLGNYHYFFKWGVGQFPPPIPKKKLRKEKKKRQWLKAKRTSAFYLLSSPIVDQKNIMRNLRVRTIFMPQKIAPASLF